MFHGYYFGYMAGMHFLWWIFWFIFIVVVFWRRDIWRLPPDEPRESPQEVLRRRLARGEISIEEYESRKAILDRDKR